MNSPINLSTIDKLLTVVTDVKKRYIYLFNPRSNKIFLKNKATQILIYCDFPSFATIKHTMLFLIQPKKVSIFNTLVLLLFG